jgi:hypothetical protein
MRSITDLMRSVFGRPRQPVPQVAQALPDTAGRVSDALFDVG